MAYALLMAAGCSSFAVALLHVGIVFAGPAAYRWFGAGERMATLAAQGSPLPAIVTLAIAAVFAIFGLYAVSGAGAMSRLPLLRVGLLAIGAIYTLRGLLLVAEVRAVMANPAALPPRELVFSAASLAIGLLYLVGTISSWRRSGA
ncbi:MAG: hypothetical protein HZC42_08440 [Candidatus Eisenbacteria bacterium]|nr:hypothetical protein [Candidatus Eisenbacteria bacterium]